MFSYEEKGKKEEEAKEERGKNISLLRKTKLPYLTLHRKTLRKSTLPIFQNMTIHSVTRHLIFLC